MRTSRPISRILFPGASRRPVRRPSIWARRHRRARAVYPQARTGRPRTPAQAPRGALLTLLRVGFTEPPRSPGVLVVSYTTVSPLPPARAGGGLFSVALSRGSPRVAVSEPPCPAESGLSSTGRPAAAARPARPRDKPSPRSPLPVRHVRRRAVSVGGTRAARGSRLMADRDVARGRRRGCGAAVVPGARTAGSGSRRAGGLTCSGCRARPP
jgi:hypothetical protein